MNIPLSVIRNPQKCFFLSLQSASAMVPVSPTLCALQLASAFVFPTTPAPSVKAVHPATTGTRTALVSRRCPSELHSSWVDNTSVARFSWEAPRCWFCGAPARLFLMTPQSKRPNSPTAPCQILLLTSHVMVLQLFSGSSGVRCMHSFLLGSRRPKNRRLGIRFWKPAGRHLECFGFIESLPQLHCHGPAFHGVVVSCPQPANAHAKARTETPATRCRASACVSQGWWVNSVTIAPQD